MIKISKRNLIMGGIALVAIGVALTLCVSGGTQAFTPFGWTLGGKKVLGGTVYVDTVRSVGSEGLKLYDAAGADGIFVEDGGNVNATGAITATSYITSATVIYGVGLDAGEADIDNVADIAADTISADDGVSFSISDDWTNAGNTIADLGTVTTADINAGSLDSITSLTAANDLDIGAQDLRAATLTADGLASGEVVIASANGQLSGDTDLTFSGDTLTVTKLGAFEATGAINFDSENMTNVDVDSGTIDGTAIGAASATTGKFTTVDVDTDVTFNSSARILGPRLKWTYVATDTVLTQADSGSWWGTYTAVAGVIFTLPTDNSNMAGVNFCFYNTEGYTVTIDPNQGASIIRRLTDHAGSNERVQSTAEHDVLCLVAGNDDIQWYPYSVYGTWADIN